MTLLQLEVARFRCIDHAQLQLDPSCNLVIGANASGKTSLLEAMFLLGSGHSFRTHQSEPLIQYGSDHFLTVGYIQTNHRQEMIGLRGWKDRKEGRINSESAQNLSELATRFPVQSIDPDVHQLLQEGPTHRRRFLDWGVFHVEPRFHDAWRRYQRALRQRNAALKGGLTEAVVRAWDQDLIEQGSQVAYLREAYLTALSPFVRNLGRRLMGLEIDLEHQQGWRRALSFELAIAESWPRDSSRASTTVGPHRADMVVKVGQVPARDRVSRGQQKLLACTLILAQQLHRAAIGAAPACLLLDDPAAELDVDNLGKLLAVIAEIPTQLVISGLNKDMLEFFPNARLFHVEHGSVQPVA